ncbi:MAG: translation initiation factor IF-3 [Verrucomicrobia bacterium]|nr:translation initiation factor IF-3 [Verrucomicrobiota bacterium]
MRTNRQIRAPKVRLIDEEGKLVGVVFRDEALRMAEEANLDLVEVVPNSVPPVCKIIDYGKFRYDQQKREKESKKAQHHIKVKEIKVKPNIDEHDFQTKLRKARDFVEKGLKVRITCMFRGRQVAHPEVGQRVVEKMVQDLDDIAALEAPVKFLGRTISTVVAPRSKPKTPVNKNPVKKETNLA